MNPAAVRWLVWSNERGRWWAPNRHGYTSSRDQAGRYEFDEAAAIVIRANHHQRNGEIPNEAMTPEPAG